MTKAILIALRSNMRQALSRVELSDAADILARLKVEDPLSAETRGFELEFYLLSGRLPEAEVLARQLTSLFPDSARIFFLSGRVAYRQKRYGEAEGLFRESLHLHPHWRTQHWLGKALTQSGAFEEAEPLLQAAREYQPRALLDLAWLYERKNDLASALQACEAFLKEQPGDSFASGQIIRLKARMLEPEALIKEADNLSALGEEPSESLLPEIVERLFQTGQDLRARENVLGRLERLDARLAVRMAWVCYRARAYDLACALFLSHVAENVSNFKYLCALESAARRSHRLPQVLEAYQSLAPRAAHLYGRLKLLGRRPQN